MIPMANDTSSQVSPPEQTNNVWPICKKQVKTCIEVEYKGETISALLDTGSDVSIAGDDVARTFGWKVHEHPTKTVKSANDEDMIIHGAARIPLRVGSRKITSEILITPDLNGLIIGIDWMEKQGQFVWNFRDGGIKFEDGDWLDLQNEEVKKRIRRVCISEDTLVPAAGNIKAKVRVTHQKINDEPFEGMLRQCEDPILNDIVFTWSLLPPRFDDMQISLVNLGDEIQIVPEGTDLGELYEAHVINLPENDECKAPKVNQIKDASSDPDEESTQENSLDA